MEYQISDPYIEKKGAFYQCNLCAAYMNSKQQVELHIYGNNHRSRLKTAKTVLQQAEASICSTQQKFSTFSSSTESNLPKYIEKRGFAYKCVCCDTPLNSNSQIINHVAGAKHRKKAKTYYEPNSVYRSETKMEIENMAPPSNGHRNVSSVSNPVFNSSLPPYVEKFGDHYKCECCHTMLNSLSQIQSHVSGLKHMQSKVFYDANPALRSAKSDCENLNRKKNVEESFDLYSSLEQINSDVSGLKHMKAKLFYDANPALRSAKSDCENLNRTKNVEESFDLYSSLEQINSDELMKSLKIIKANEEVIF